MVTHPSSNRVQCRASSLVRPATCLCGSDLRPVFESAAESTQLVAVVAEDAAPGHVVCRCAAVSPAAGAQLRYHWLNDSAQGFDVRGEEVNDHDDYLQVSPTENMAATVYMYVAETLNWGVVMGTISVLSLIHI